MGVDLEKINGGFILLSHYENVAGKELEIVINYYIPDESKDSIVQISISKEGHFTIPVTDLFKGVPELWEAICIVVDRVDWKAVYEKAKSGPLCG